MKKKFSALIALGALLLTTGCNVDPDESAMEQLEVEDEKPTEKEQDKFAEWDTDDNRQLSESEFRDRVRDQGLPQTLGTGDDEVIDEDDWGTMMYTEANGNEGGLDENEWQDFTERWNDYEWDAFEKWDLNKDGVMDEEEWRQAYAGTESYRDIDTDEDQKITKDEYARYSFRSYDDDEDDRLSREEFNDYVKDWEL